QYGRDWEHHQLDGDRGFHPAQLRRQQHRRQCRRQPGADHNLPQITLPNTRTRLPMNKLLVVIGLLLLGLPLDASVAHAQLARPCVSAAGSDSNDCTRLTPCRTFQRAHDNTLANGEITVLDPGGYGAVTITKSISIINDGVGEAGVLVSGGLSGITVAAGASDAVTLRGLTIKGIGFGGGDGVTFTSGRSLTVENCVIRNLSGINGIGLHFR